MAFSCFLHRKFHRPSISDLFGARSFALIPTCLALLTSVFILVYISSTSKLIRHQHDHSHLLLLRSSVKSSRISYQIVQTSFHNPPRNASDGVPPESIIEGNEVQSVSNYSREGAEIHQPVVVLRSDGSNRTLVYGDNPVWSHAGELVDENRQPAETHQSNDSNDEPPVWNSSHGVGIGQPLQSRPSADSEGNHLKEVFHDKENFFEDYKEMNRSFKIYVYPHSKDDPFANTLLPVNSEPGGNYASEAYFKKALTKSHFITKDPSEADLFYMPFSIAALRHDRRVGVGGIPVFVQAYIHNISHTYPYWNRSGGADHFYVACHSIGNTATKKADEVRLNAIQLVCSSSYFVTAYVAHKDASMPQIWPRHDDPPTFSLSKRNESHSGKG
uniref:Exostosin GT47 domain-containing protein n=1 Tax=Nelumbo nucifera TaxID=4432 RepID=A0A822ZQG0_NELNU|nr:TPA_asm: hypothetical protein HUJ06_017040 [Nelumbo nucifera]